MESFLDFPPLLEQVIEIILDGGINMFRYFLFKRFVSKKPFDVTTDGEKVFFVLVDNTHFESLKSIF